MLERDSSYALKHNELKILEKKEKKKGKKKKIRDLVSLLSLMFRGGTRLFRKSWCRPLTWFSKY